MALLDELQAAGRTVVLITHDSDVAEMAGRTVRLRDGLILPDRELVR
jgi:putative ABC transport system ATP-binding protein